MRRREALGWGLVGALSFLVLVQGYELVAAVRLEFGLKAVVALAVAGWRPGWPGTATGGFRATEALNADNRVARVRARMAER